MQVIQIKTIEFEDLLDGVYKLEKRLDKIDEKLSGSRIKYVPLKEALKILNIERKTADNWYKSGILKKKTLKLLTSRKDKTNYGFLSFK